MPARAAPLFLARRAYRMRRLMDAGRLLPLLGAALVMIPGLWQPAATSGPDTARGAVYLFSVWCGLILAAAALAPGLRRAMAEEDEGARPGAHGQDAP